LSVERVLLVERRDLDVTPTLILRFRTITADKKWDPAKLDPPVTMEVRSQFKNNYFAEM